MFFSITQPYRGEFDTSYTDCILFTFCSNNPAAENYPEDVFSQYDIYMPNITHCNIIHNYKIL